MSDVTKTEGFSASDFARFRCFACAPPSFNAHGLHLKFEATEDGAQTRFSLASYFQSYPGFLHGGILAGVLDETMAYTAVLKLHRLPWTRSIEVQYRRGVEAEKDHLCVARLLRREGDEIETTAVLKTMAGATLVSAKGRFVLPSFELARKMMAQMDLTPWREFFG